MTTKLVHSINEHITLITDCLTIFTDNI